MVRSFPLPSSNLWVFSTEWGGQTFKRESLYNYLEPSDSDVSPHLNFKLIKAIHNNWRDWITCFYSCIPWKFPEILLSILCYVIEIGLFVIVINRQFAHVDNLFCSFRMFESLMSLRYIIRRIRTFGRNATNLEALSQPHNMDFSLHRVQRDLWNWTNGFDCACICRDSVFLVRRTSIPHIPWVGTSLHSALRSGKCIFQSLGKHVRISIFGRWTWVRIF